MNRSQALLAAAAVLAAAFFVNLIFSAFSARTDLTEDQTFTLSAGTKRILTKLDETVTLELFVSRSDVKLPSSLEPYSQRVEVLLREYVAASGGKVELILTDPRPDTKEEQRAQRNGMTPLRANRGEAYFGITAKVAGTLRALPLLDPARERFLEFDLSKLIASVARLERPRLAIISSLPISNSLPQGNEQQQPGPADLLLGELGQTFEIVTINTSDKTLPKDVAVVALVHAHHIDPQLAYAVDQFLLRGGSVFAAVDPLSRVQKFQQGNIPFMMAPMALNASSDPAMLRSWGVSVEMDAIVGDTFTSIPLAGNRGDAVQYPPFFSTKPDSFAKDSPLVSDFSDMAFMEAGAISLISGAEKRLQFAPLVTQTGQGIGAVPTTVANTGPFEKVGISFKTDGKPRTLVAMVTGIFESAYPKGAPAPEPNEPSRPGEPPKPPTPSPTPTAPHLVASEKPGRLLVVADSDFMMDTFTLSRRQFAGQTVATPRNDNFAFIVGSLETLAGTDELVSLRSKGTSIRPFKVVESIEREAQKSYQKKLDEIETRLAEANSKIAELSQESGGTKAKGILITPEIKQEIEKFQDLADKLSDERRTIRRGLSEDVNSLGRRLQILNLIAGPAFALLFGLLYAWFRRRKIT